EHNVSPKLVKVKIRAIGFNAALKFDAKEVTILLNFFYFQCFHFGPFDGLKILCLDSICNKNLQLYLPWVVGYFDFVVYHSVTNNRKIVSFFYCLIVTPCYIVRMKVNQQTNENMKHTPGPWHVNTLEVVPFSIHAHRGCVAEV